MSAIQRLHPGVRFSAVSIHNGTVYVAGQVAADSSQDVAGQTRQVLATIDKLLAEAGSDKSRILMAQIFLPDIADFAAMNAVWDAWVSKDAKPCRATVESRLASPDLRVEIVVTAAI